MSSRSASSCFLSYLARSSGFHPNHGCLYRRRIRCGPAYRGSYLLSLTCYLVGRMCGSRPYRWHRPFMTNRHPLGSRNGGAGRGA